VKRFLLPVASAVLAVTFAGCVSFHHAPYGEFGSSRCTGNNYCCRGADDCGDCNSTHCGLCGIGCTIARESCALVHCLFSYQWEGNYPDGAMHPWAGSWSGGCCCPPGCSDPYADVICEEEIEYVTQ